MNRETDNSSRAADSSFDLDAFFESFDAATSQQQSRAARSAERMDDEVREMPTNGRSAYASSQVTPSYGASSQSVASQSKPQTASSQGAKPQASSSQDVKPHASPLRSMSSAGQALRGSLSQGTASMKALFKGALPKGRSSQADSGALDSTMSYSAIGEEMPELPFANEDEKYDDTSEIKPSIEQRRPSTSRAGASAADLGKQDRSSAAQDSLRAGKGRSYAEQDNAYSRQDSSRNGGDRSYTDQDSSSSRQDRSYSSQSRSSKSQSDAYSDQDTDYPGSSASTSLLAPRKRIERPSMSLGASSSSQRQQPENRSIAAWSPRTRVPQRPRGRYESGPFTPLYERGSSYRIRGGGRSRLKSPLFIISYCFVVILGVLMSWYVLQQAYIKLTTNETNNPVTLTEQQTRTAIDAGLPKLFSIIDVDFAEIISTMEDAGEVIFTDERYNPESIDPSAIKVGFIRMPKEVTADFMTGFYGGTYNAYQVDVLEDYFNGAYTLDMSDGSLGIWFKLRYMNLCGESVDAEMQHLLTLQGLTGEGVTVIASGSDPQGNKVIQGTKEIDEETYYWKIAACRFNQVYTVTRLLDNAVWISCTIADFDFYTGGDVIS
ncbi:MAG: hypothetical protein FWD43_00905 [Coriobacteriia bacterium]|nr:hypothetical protein [Coriobacteriia bacterium]